jgi:DNA-binding HxlR family transcriptional regulator
VSSTSSWRTARRARPLDLVADTWSVVVVFGLGDRPLRYSELRERIGGISKKMLTQTLRKLERNGLVERRRLATAPPGVEYELTALGLSLLGPVSALSRWTEENTDALLVARGEPSWHPAARA